MKFLANGKIVTMALLALSLANHTTGRLAGHAQASEASAISDRAVAAWVDKRVQEWQITAGERKFDEIGWAKNIRDALRLAKEHGRPVFLFTYDGHMAIGRC